MATSYKVLGQSAPSSASNTDIYTVPASTEAVVSTLNVCNRGSAQGFFRVAVRPDAESLANKHYVAYDVAIDANSSIPWTIGITLNAGDVITVYSSSADMSFNVFGSEIS